MTVRLCRECGQEVEAEAEECPNCGAAGSSWSRPVNETDPRGPAHHEAGHAVAREVLGLRTALVELYVDAETRQWTGQLIAGGDPEPPPDDLTRREVVALLAGLAADERFTEIPAAPFGHAGGDYGDAHRRLMKEGLDGDERRARIEELEEEARRLVEENWPAVEAVADALLEGVDSRRNGIVMGDRLTELVVEMSGAAEEEASD